MFKTLGRDHWLIMLSLLIWALGEGLWFNLRQILLAELQATPSQIGTALAVEMLGRALPLIPAGFAINRFGPRLMMIAAWAAGIVGVVAIALAPTWPMVALGLALYAATAFAIPAFSAYALLSPGFDGQVVHNPQTLMVTIFASYPVGLIVSPWLGGWIAGQLDIRACLWISAGLFTISTLVLVATRPVPRHVEHMPRPIRALLGNRRYVIRVVVYTMGIFALYVGASLAPNFLRDVRGLSLGQIGLLYSILALGTITSNMVIARLSPGWGFPMILTTAGLAVLGIWQVQNVVGIMLAFLVLGGIHSIRAVAIGGLAGVVSAREQGMAFSLLEMLLAGGTAIAARLAGELYGLTPSRDLPFAAGLVCLAVVVVLWLGAQGWRASRPGAGTAGTPAS